jgi:hypothetical protein
MSHFTPDEFRCRCGRKDCDAPRTPDTRLIALLDRIRDRLGRPLRITSGARCAYWNVKVGGAIASGHLYAGEADVAVLGSTPRYELVRAALAEGCRRIGVGRDFVHLGVSAQLAQDVLWHYYPFRKEP